MRYVPCKPIRSTSVLLFKVARTQLMRNSVNVAKLSDAYLSDAYISPGKEELNVNSDDISGTSRQVEAPRAAKAQPAISTPRIDHSEDE
jgi:hypothetical protein